jgi:hypothetical protein
LRQFTKRQRDIPGLTNMAEAALQEKDYLRTAIFLAEAVEKARDQALPGDNAQDESIKKVRNALAHAGQFRDGSPYFETRAKLEDFLTRQIKRFRDEMTTRHDA